MKPHLEASILAEIGRGSIRHSPVCTEGKLAGVFSIGDAVKAIMTEQKIKIENLENYIMGKYQ